MPEKYPFCFLVVFICRFMKKVCLLLIVCLTALSVTAEKVYDFNSTCQQAYSEITRLRIASGQKLINQARQQNPDNLIPEMLEGYIDFFILFFNEDPAEYNKRQDNFANRIDAYEEGPHNSPFYNYCRAVSLMQRATVGIKFGERVGPCVDFKKAYGLVKSNKKAFPNFLPNDILFGPLEVIIGTVPDKYKWITNLFGLKGSISGGMHLMQNLITSNDNWARLFNTEATFYYCYLKFYLENQQDEILQYIQSRKLDVVNNHLFTYLAVNLGINSKQTEYARSILLKRNTSADYLYTPVWDYEMGRVNLYHLDYQEAINCLERFIRNFKGNVYVKDALQKISWAYYLQGNMAAAERTRNLLLKKGNTNSDADKQANKAAKSGTWPNPLLLKARLLSDGGYNREALGVLHGKSQSDFSKPEEALEFAYRLGRIYDDMGSSDSAINAYLTSIRLGEKRKEYFAARAALQIGYIYEKRGQKSMAITYFQKCLDMDDHDYKDSLDQRAKSGIARCKGE